MQRDSLNTTPSHVLASLLAILTVGLVAGSATFFYCALHPFGISPPSPPVCWSIGTALLFAACGSAYGIYHFVRQARLAAQAPPADVTPPAPAGFILMPPTPRLTMQDAALRQPALQQGLDSLAQALIDAAPSHYSMLHLLVEARKSEGKNSVLFTYGSPLVVSEYSTIVPDSVSHAACSVVDHLLRQNAAFPGFEIGLRRTSAGKWETDFHGLDDPSPQWSKFPRYPLRVCGYGLSLAPAPGTIFRWMRNRNPVAVVAAARKGADSQFRQVHIKMAQTGPGVLLGDGVLKAEDIVQVSEGPAAMQWTIETPQFRSIWPDAFDLRYPLTSKTRFDLIGKDDALLFVQGPFEGNILDEMGAAGQIRTGRGTTPKGHDWIELGYQNGGAEWRQRHYSRPIAGSRSFIITAQCPKTVADLIFDSSAQFADSFQAAA